ncbi:MAG: DUF1636 domain-containing protein [Pseudomonadota bacterium]
MTATPIHQIVICTSCREPKQARRNSRGGAAYSPGSRLMTRLMQALENSLPVPQFELKAADCMAGCSRPCTVAFQSDRKACYLFGDIDPDGPLEPLIVFAEYYASLDDGWCSSRDRPSALANKTLARIPAPPRTTTGQVEVVS